jgi:hypothetical protein
MSMDDYFEYILLSKVNGQHKQVEDLIKEMSKYQKKDCFTYFSNQEQTDDNLYCKKKIIAFL